MDSPVVALDGSVHERRGGRHPTHRPLEFAAIYVLLDDGIAEAISRPWFERWPLLPDGRFDADRLMARALSLIDIRPARDPGSPL